ncbi:hypothetical protein AVEN_159760-1 [Araneus ventricosus]|uniref:Uncharacterized protein n=1 Tax=Araneus ventricosus TaxID=182803 RepID=A0A4Y2S2U8_ARAVE|nr:hypothetical protein AVEN_159760-1 [Araneus ventricosus]
MIVTRIATLPSELQSALRCSPTPRCGISGSPLLKTQGSPSPRICTTSLCSDPNEYRQLREPVITDSGRKKRKPLLDSSSFKQRLDSAITKLWVRYNTKY